MSIMSFIGEAMEACSTCNNGTGADGKVVNGYDGKNDPNAIKQTDHTYSDGEGVHDTVMIKGPLSEVFTKALNVSLKKQPLQPQQESPTPETVTEQAAEEKSDLLKQHSAEKIGFGTESSQIDESNLQYLVREFDEHSAEIKFVANKFDFCTPDELPKNVNCQATLISMTDFMSPTKVCEILDQAPNSKVQRVLVVVSDSLGRASGHTTQQRLVDVHYTGDEYSNLKHNPQFNTAVEDHFKPIDMKVVIGIEGFFAFLEDYHNGKKV